MKLFKKIQVGLLSTVSIASTGVVISSCGHKKHAVVNTYDDFAKAAAAELIINVVTQTKPNGWDGMTAGDLVSKGYSENPEIEVFLTLKSSSKQETAQFGATYKTNQKYQLSDWSVVNQPKKSTDFENFKIKAEAQEKDLSDLVKNANPKATGWDSLPKGDLSKVSSSETTNSVIFVISSKTKGKQADFTATYVPDQLYKISDWACTKQPY